MGSGLQHLDANFAKMEACWNHRLMVSAKKSLFKCPRHQGEELSRVFLQTATTHFDEAKLALDQAKWMLNLGPHTRLELFHLVDQLIVLVGLVQRTAFARAHGHMPGDIRLCMAQRDEYWVT